MTAYSTGTVTCNGDGPRTELSEANEWQVSKTGTASLSVTKTITADHPIIVAQLFDYDSNKPWLFVKYNAGRLYSLFDDGVSKTVTLEASLPLFTPFTIDITVSKTGTVSLHYTNPTTKASVTSTGVAGVNTNYYFKTGTYDQGLGFTGQTLLQALSVSHK